ncbi:MAG TPA: RodZ domain-containing protein [Thermoanaerobaculia bacterium]|nr:RodZ domain-containing protein [Thermoanaerobaculia bacterium]
MANERGSGGGPVAEERQDEAVVDEASGDDMSAGDRVVGGSSGDEASAEPFEEVRAEPSPGDEPIPRRNTAEDNEEFPLPPPAAGEDQLPSPPRRSGAAAGTAAAGASGHAGRFDGPALGGEISFGTWLRRQRELREIDLREIADKTKISLRYLKAMEQDRFEILPAPVFARGFLREYSKYVGLNADEVVNYYLASHEGRGLEEEVGETVVEAGSSRGPITRGAFMVLLLIVVVAGIAYFLFYRRSQEEAQRAAPPPIAPPAVESVVPAEAPPPPDEAVLTAPLVVTLDFTQECWVEARVDGVPDVTRLFVAGESIQLEAEESVTLTLGNGGGVEVQVNNMPFDLRAGPGELVTDLTIDLAMVERLRQRSG